MTSGAMITLPSKYSVIDQTEGIPSPKRTMSRAKGRFLVAFSAISFLEFVKYGKNLLAF